MLLVTVSSVGNSMPTAIMVGSLLIQQTTSCPKRLTAVALGIGQDVRERRPSRRTLSFVLRSLRR
jgi:hypothetical protein